MRQDELEAVQVGQQVRATDLGLTGTVVEIGGHVALIDFGNHERWWSMSSLEPVTTTPDPRT